MAELYFKHMFYYMYVIFLNLAFVTQFKKNNILLPSNSIEEYIYMAFFGIHWAIYSNIHCAPDDHFGSLEMSLLKTVLQWTSSYTCSTVCAVYTLKEEILSCKYKHFKVPKWCQIATLNGCTKLWYTQHCRYSIFKP